MSRRPLILLCLITTVLAACYVYATPIAEPKTGDIRSRALPTATFAAALPGSTTAHSPYPPPLQPTPWYDSAYPGPNAPTLQRARDLTERGAGTDAPRVLDRQPRDWWLSERRPTIRLTFDRAMDRAGIASALRVEPAIPLDLALAGGDPCHQTAPASHARLSL